MPHSPEANYYQDNRQALENVVNSFEVALRLRPHRILLFKDVGMAFDFVEGKQRPQDWIHLSNDRNRSLTPAQRAEEMNYFVVNQASSLLEIVLRSVSNEDFSFHYQTAVLRRISVTNESSQTKGLVAALELFGAIPLAFYNFRIEKSGPQGTSERFNLLTLDNEAVAISYELKAGHDELKISCLQMFGPEPRLIKLFAGDFEDIEEAKSILDSLRRASIPLGIYPASEIGALLDAVYDRCQSTMQDREHFDTHDLGLPSLEKLGHIATFLYNLRDPQALSSQTRFLVPFRRR